jgi:DNA repair protein RadC
MGQRDPLFGLLPQILADPAAAHDLFAPLGGEKVEVAAFVYLGAEQQLLGIRHARSDSPDTLDLPIREIVRDALAFDARGVVIAHNHPGGDPTPSRADRDVTRQLVRALDPLGIRLLDHLVIAHDGAVSFRRLGLL